MFRTVPLLKVGVIMMALALMIARHSEKRLKLLYTVTFTTPEPWSDEEEQDKPANEDLEQMAPLEPYSRFVPVSLARRRPPAIPRSVPSSPRTHVLPGQSLRYPSRLTSPLAS